MSQGQPHTIKGVTTSGTPFVMMHQTGSTNDDARAGLNQGQRGPRWFLAERQISGRGRRGRSWQAQDGNLFASLLIHPPVAASSAPQLAFVAGIAVVDALHETTGTHDQFRCKWPNDVLHDGAKIAGILLESGGKGAGGVDYVIVGIGVNLARTPEVPDQPVTSLPALGLPAVAQLAFLDSLDHQVLTLMDQWLNHGFAPIRARWLSMASGLGQAARIHDGRDSFHARIDDMDADGALVVTLDDGKSRRIHAGDIFPAE